MQSNALRKLSRYNKNLTGHPLQGSAQNQYHLRGKTNIWVGFSHLQLTLIKLGKRALAEKYKRVRPLSGTLAKNAHTTRAQLTRAHLASTHMHSSAASQPNHLIQARGLRVWVLNCLKCGRLETYVHFLYGTFLLLHCCFRFFAEKTGGDAVLFKANCERMRGKCVMAIFDG